VLRKESDGQPPARAQEDHRPNRHAVAFGPGGALVVHLDNGQIWEQTEEGPELHVAAGRPQSRSIVDCWGRTGCHALREGTWRSRSKRTQ